MYHTIMTVNHVRASSLQIRQYDGVDVDDDDDDDDDNDDGDDGDDDAD